MKPISQSCYELLGVPLGAEPETVARAWRERRAELIDRLRENPNPEAEALISRLDEAFAILGHPQVSRRYRLYQGERGGGSQVLTPDELMDPDRKIPVEKTVDAVLRQVLYPPHWRAPKRDTEIEDIRSVAEDDSLTDSIRWPLPETPDEENRLLEAKLADKLADRLELLRGVLLAAPGPEEAPIPMESRQGHQRARLDLAGPEWFRDSSPALPTEESQEHDPGSDQEEEAGKDTVRVCPPWVR